MPCPIDALHAAADAPNMLQPAAPSSNTLSALLSVGSSAAYGTLLENDSREATRLLSAGGATAGKSLVAPAGHQNAQFTDDQLTEILRWRLGITSEQAMPLCQNVSAATGDTCGEMLDAWGMLLGADADLHAYAGTTTLQTTWLTLSSAPAPTPVGKHM